MSSNKKRAAAWMNNALFDYYELKYVEFKVQNNSYKDEFLSKAIKKTYSLYGHEQNLSKQSWYNLRSGIKVLYGFDICDDKFPRARQAYKVKIGEAKETCTEGSSDDENVTMGEMIAMGNNRILKKCCSILQRKFQWKRK